MPAHRITGNKARKGNATRRMPIRADQFIRHAGVELALATTPSGKWLGLDGLIQFLNPFRKRRAQPANPAIAAKAA